MATQAQILKGPIMSNNLKEATSLLHIKKSTKDTKVKHNVFENIANALKSFGRSGKGIDRIAHRVIQTTIVSSTTKDNRLTNYLVKSIGTSQNTLRKHNKFWLQINANKELACWAMICRKPYKYRLGEGVKAMVHEYWVTNSHVSPKARDVL